LSILEQIMRHLRAELAPGPKSQLTADTKIFGEGYLDSTSMLELLIWVEDTYRFSIQNEDLTPENFGTARNLFEYVERNLQKPVISE
jgi:acyl carrier protein